MAKNYIVAYDVGTTACKAVIVDFDANVVSDVKKEYPLIQLQPGWAELDTELLWDAMCVTTKAAMAKAGITPDQIQGLNIAAPWKNIIPVDKDGKVLRHSIIWMDGRGVEQAARLNEKFGSFVGTGQEIWPRLMWVKEKEREIWDKAEWIMGLITYLKWRATGEIATDPSDSFFESFSKKNQTHFDKVVAAAGLEEDRRKFPKLKESTEMVGVTTERAAKELGLRPGIPMFGGFCDLPALTIGTGCCRMGDNHMQFGTSGWFVHVVPERVDNFAPQYMTFDPTKECAMFAMQTAGLSYDWVISQLYHEERKRLGDEAIYPFVNKEVGQVEAGSLNLLATHWLIGELPPFAKNAKGLFFNLTSNHDRRHMARAILECQCYTERMYVDMYRKFTGKTLENIRCVGGGAQSDEWMQILSDVLQVPVDVPANPRFAGAMGAYYCAMIGLGHIENYDSLYDTVRIERSFKPNPANKEVYDKLYGIYVKLYPTLKGLCDEINGVY